MSTRGEITLRLFLPLKGMVGRQVVALVPVRNTVAGLLEQLLAEHPQVREELLDAAGNVGLRYTVAVNRKFIDRARWDLVRLSEEDEVALMTIVTGG